MIAQKMDNIAGTSADPEKEKHGTWVFEERFTEIQAGGIAL